MIIGKIKGSTLDAHGRKIDASRPRSNDYSRSIITNDPNTASNFERYGNSCAHADMQNTPSVRSKIRTSINTPRSKD